VFLSGKCDPPNYYTNAVNNQKSNIITFLPLFFYNQFRAFFNLFFLGITISQFFPMLRVGTVGRLMDRVADYVY